MIPTQLSALSPVPFLSLYVASEHEYACLMTLNSISHLSVQSVSHAETSTLGGQRACLCHHYSLCVKSCSRSSLSLPWSFGSWGTNKHSVSISCVYNIMQDIVAKRQDKQHHALGDWSWKWAERNIKYLNKSLTHDYHITRTGFLIACLLVIFPFSAQGCHCPPIEGNI